MQSVFLLCVTNRVPFPVTKIFSPSFVVFFYVLNFCNSLDATEPQAVLGFYLTHHHLRSLKCGHTASPSMLHN